MVWSCLIVCRIWLLDIASTRVWKGWPCLTVCKAWLLAFTSTRVWMAWPCPDLWLVLVLEMLDLWLVLVLEMLGLWLLLVLWDAWLVTCACAWDAWLVTRACAWCLTCACVRVNASLCYGVEMPPSAMGTRCLPLPWGRDASGDEMPSLCYGVEMVWTGEPLLWGCLRCGVKPCYRVEIQMVDLRLCVRLTRACVWWWTPVMG